MVNRKRNTLFFLSIFAQTYIYTNDFDYKAPVDGIGSPKCFKSHRIRKLTVFYFNCGLIRETGRSHQSNEESSSEGLWNFSQIHYAFTHTLFKCHDISECLAILKTLLCHPTTTSQQKELRLGAFSSVIISVSYYSTQNLNATALKPVRLQRQIFVNMSLG